jgi:hypothetical protein
LLVLIARASRRVQLFHPRDGGEQADVPVCLDLLGAVMAGKLPERAPRGRMVVGS